MRFLIYDVIYFIIDTTGISLLDLHFIVDIASVITILALCYVICSLIVRSMLYRLFISQFKDVTLNPLEGGDTMGLIDDRFPLACPLAKEDGFICPGMNSFDGCSVYNNDGILLRKRIGYCDFKNLRRPEIASGIVGKKKFVNPLKASKRKAKTGTIAVEET